MNQTISIMVPITDRRYHSIEEIANELRYLSQPFSKEAVEAAIIHKSEITPKLLEFLNYAYKHHEILDDDYIGHLYALFLLAEFRESRAFAIVMDILELPDDSLELLLSETLTESYAQIITSVYNGDLARIKKVIENPDNDLYARMAAVDSLVSLVKVSALDREEIIPYMASLFQLESFRSDPVALGFLVCTASALQSESLYSTIEELFKLDLVDKSIVNLNDVEYYKTNDYDNYANEYKFGYIDSAIDSMSWWHCFKKEEQFIPQVPVVRGTKIGRNDPCPCGSGKKYKKCCGSNL